MHEFNPRHIELRIVFPHIFRALLLSELLDHRFHSFGVVTGTHTGKAQDEESGSTLSVLCKQFHDFGELSPDFMVGDRMAFDEFSHGKA
ncbi:MAG: hypothetical protein WB762_05385 [Candidatus Sulfotelmatobacter sp.]